MVLRDQKVGQVPPGVSLSESFCCATLYPTLPSKNEREHMRTLITIVVFCLLPKYDLMSQEIKGNVQSHKGILYPVIVGGKVGFINNQGQIVICPQFDLYGKGHFEGITHISSKSFKETVDEIAWDEEILFPRFHKGILPISKNGLTGFINLWGDIIIPPVYMASSGFHNGFAWVTDEYGKSALFDMHGNCLFFGAQDYGLMSEGLIAVKIGEDWGYITPDGSIKIPTMFDSADAFCNGLAKVKKDGRTFYIDRSGKEFAGKMTLSNQFVLNQQDGKWGIRAVDETFSIKPLYHFPLVFREGVARVSEDGKKFGVIDVRGENIVPMQYDDLGESVAERIPFAVRNESGGLLWGCINFHNEVLVPAKHNSLRIIRYGQTCFMIVSDVNNMYGLLDGRGSTILECRYISLSSIENDGVLKAISRDRNDRYVGLYSLSGHWLFTPKFYDVSMVESEGLRWVLLHNKFGFIDSTGNVIIEPKFDWAENFSNGMARVGFGVINFAGSPLGGTWGYIDHSGKWVWEPTN